MRALAVVVLLLAAAAAEEEVACRVAYVESGGFYVDAGSKDGLAEGDLGFLRRAGADPVQVQVVAVSSSSARVRLVGPKPSQVSPADPVVFRIAGRAAPPAEPESGPVTRAADQPFVPLLDREKGVKSAERPRNISHGWIGARQLIQEDLETGFDYMTTVLASRGGIERIGGSEWALRWNGNVTYRSGDAFADSPLEGADVYLFELSAARTLASGGFLRLGRLLPAGLRVGGYLDGVQAEQPLGDAFRVGAVAGLRPNREDLAPSADEPTVLPYATVELGQRGASWFSGTAGFLGAWFDGELDRTALVTQMHYESGRRFRVDATVDVDFDAGSSLYKEGTQLSLFDLVASGDVGDALTLRAGAYRFERIDNAAQRALAPGVEPEVFLDEFWRTWVGATVRLGERWSLDGETAWILDDVDPTTLHWRARATWYDPFGAVGGNLAVTIYNLEGLDGSEGLGARIDGYFPLANGRWIFQPAFGVRQIESAGLDFRFLDARLRVEHGFGRGWSAYADVSYATGEALDSVQLELGLNHYW